MVPVILFVYNRLEHTRQTLEALAANPEAAQTELIVYADGPKTPEAAPLTQEVRRLAATFPGFQSVRVIEREKNIGLAQSIITGVSEVLTRHEAAIILEDDLVTSPYFLRYMNQGLDLYRNEKRVASIQGYCYPMKGALPETYFLRGAECWGWATWRDRWTAFEPDSLKLLAELSARALNHEFDVLGSCGFTQMLQQQADGKISSWAIRWQASTFLKNWVSLYPGRSLVKNIGFDGSGVHCSESDQFAVDFSPTPVRIEKSQPDENRQALEKLAEFWRSLNTPSPAAPALGTASGMAPGLEAQVARIKDALRGPYHTFKRLTPGPIKRAVKTVLVNTPALGPALFPPPPPGESPEDRYPRILGNEVQAVTDVLHSGCWNFSQSTLHERLEENFAAFVGTKHAVAVNSGGVALQMAIRALGLKPGDEVIHQVDTCVANAFGAIAAHATPIFADIDPATFMLSRESLEKWIGPRTRAIIPIHMWGNIENMDMVGEVARKHGLKVLEDGCLALGAKLNGQAVGSRGDASIFSFGTLKPMQSGEGGMIATNDEALARELRTLRVWGDRSSEFGVRDQTTPAWNGRISEILVAVLLEQLKGYPAFLAGIQSNAALFQDHLKNYEGIRPVFPDRPTSAGTFTQVVVRIEEELLGMSKTRLMEALRAKGHVIWHACFEPINQLTFFRTGLWKDWIVTGDLPKVAANYAHRFETSERVFAADGLGFFRVNFVSEAKTRALMKCIDEVLARARRS